MIIENVPLKDLRPSKDRVRITVGEEGLDALALSIKEKGQEVPIKVRPNGNGYEIIYGHRRAEASKRSWRILVVPNLNYHRWWGVLPKQ